MTDALDFCGKWLAAWTGNQPEKLRQFYTHDAFYRDPARPEGLRGPELLPYFKKLLAANPSWIWQIAELFPTSNGFCLKWSASIPIGATIVRENGLDIVELRDGKISRNEVYFDRAALLAAMRAQQK
jgi:hypothetical protein